MTVTKLTEATFGIESGRVVCRVDGISEFHDSVEHWNDAVLRLLEQDEAVLSNFIRNVCLQLVNEGACGEDVIRILRENWRRETDVSQVMPQAQRPSWLPLNLNDATWLTESVRDSTEFGMAYSPNSDHAWLSHRESGVPASTESLAYEFEYFEGDKKGIGYGSYANQASWRIEKAHRQCREVSAIMTFFGVFEKPRVLDVGSGYGFFRKACADVGWASQGVEISSYACRAAREMFGMDTYCGTLNAYSENSANQFDVIVMWDFIEHVDDPTMVLSHAQKLLSDGGFLFIRTPNLNAVEFEVFGSSFHSLKREHLNLFSPKSLSRCMLNSGIQPVMTLSESHLLAGFRRSETSVWATSLRGSDLIAVGRNFGFQRAVVTESLEYRAEGDRKRC